MGEDNNRNETTKALGNKSEKKQLTRIWLKYYISYASKGICNKVKLNSIIIVITIKKINAFLC